MKDKTHTLRAKGHKLSMEWSGEYGAESSSTGTCPCGWEESGSSQEVVRDEYRWHLMRVLGIHPVRNREAYEKWVQTGELPRGEV